MHVRQTMKILALTLLAVTACSVPIVSAEDSRLIIPGAAPHIGPDGRTTEAIGLETLGGEFTALLERGCSAPCSRTETFTTAADRQTQVTVTLYRGNAKAVSQAELVGAFRIDRCVSGRRGTPQVALTILMMNRDLVLSATELGSRTTCHITQESRG